MGAGLRRATAATTDHDRRPAPGYEVRYNRRQRAYETRCASANGPWRGLYRTKPEAHRATWQAWLDA